MFNILPRSWRRSIQSLMTVGCILYGSEVALAANFDVANDFQLRTAIQSAGGGDTITFVSNVTLTDDLPTVGGNISFVGNGFTLDSDQHQAFRIGAGTVSISNLTIIDARTVGDDGLDGTSQRGGEGGSAGLGGAIFVGSTANLTLTNVTINDNSAIGGDGGSSGGSTISTGADGAAGTFGTGGTGGQNGDAAPPDPMDPMATLPPIPGGDGGIGGFGGGGGGGGSGAGLGGIGGLGGDGGFGGGDGADGTETVAGGGGGGAGLGGAIFVQTGGTLTFGGTLTINGNTVTGGSAGSPGAIDGLASGSGLFLQNDTTAIFNPAAGETMTVFDNISDESNGSVVKNGEGTLILLGNNNYGGGTSVLAGILQGDTDSLQGEILNNATLIFQQDVIGGFSGLITGTGVVIKEGSGTLIYLTPQDNRGGTIINAGILRAAGIDVLPGWQDITINTDATLDLNNFDQSIGGLNGDGNVLIGTALLTINPEITPATFGGIISGTGALLKNGTGTQILLGANTYTGGTTVDGGVLQGTTISLQGDIVNNATVTFDQDFDGTFSGLISGPGQVIKENVGVLTYGVAQTYTGGTTINGGTLRVLGDNFLVTTADVTLSAGGTLDLNDQLQTVLGLNGTGGTVLIGSRDFTVTPTGIASFAGSIQGTGSFIMNGTGTQILTGLNTYSGGTQILSGTLQGDTNGLQGDILNSSALVFDQTFTGTYGGVISGTGTVTKQNTGTVILTGANTYSGGTTVTDGVLQGDTTSLQGNIDNSASLVFDQSFDGTFGGTISGTGTVTKQNSGQLVFNTPQSHTGLTTVDEGLLTVNSSLAGPVLVNTNGTLGGNGSMGATTVNGKIAPGNSIGTLNVNGTYTQNANSTYEVEINGAGQSDLISVNGDAVINGGTVQVVPLTGDERRGQIFTILQSTGGVTGQYAAISSGLPGYIGTRLIYNPLDIQLVLTSNFLGALGGTENQRSIEQYFDGLTTTPGTDLDGIFATLDTLSPDQARAAFDQIAGAQNASLTTLGRMRNLYLIDQVSDQLRASIGDGIIFEGNDTSTWFKSYGISGDIDSDGNAPGIDYDFAGFIAGLETRADAGTRAGLFAGYTYSNADFSGAVSNASGDARGDGVAVGTYASKRFGAIHVLGAANYGFTDVTTNRAINFDDVNRTATGDPNVHDANVYMETGYLFSTNLVELQPIFGLQYMYLHQQSFTETGADSLNMSVDSQDTKSLWAMVGGRLALLPIQGGAWDYRPYVHGKWVHDCLNDDSLFNSSLVGAGGSFAVRGAAVGRDFVVAGTGLNLQRGNFSLNFDYTALTNDDQTAHAGSGSVQFVW